MTKRIGMIRTTDIIFEQRLAKVVEGYEKAHHVMVTGINIKRSDNGMIGGFDVEY